MDFLYAFICKCERHEDGENVGFLKFYGNQASYGKLLGLHSAQQTNYQ